MSEPTPIRRRYTREQKARTVGIAISKGQTAAAEETGIPLTTLNQWYNAPEYVALRTTAREDVAEQMWIGVQVGVSEMVRMLRHPRVPLRDKTVATSMLSEKMLLLRGEATARTEHRELVEELNDHERETLRTLLDSALQEASLADSDRTAP